MTENTEIGQIRFFDHKKGFGFIDVLGPDSEHHGKEVFFHFTEINCESSFKKVIPGEIVYFNVSNKPGDNTKKVCTNIKGVYGSKMLVDNDTFIYKMSKKRDYKSTDRQNDQNDQDEQGDHSDQSDQGNEEGK